MTNFKSLPAIRPALLLVGALVTSLAWPLTGVAQDKDLAAQVRDLQAKVVTLEAALNQNQPAMPSGTGGMPMSAGGMPSGSGGMKGMEPGEMMQMMQMMMSGMGGGKQGMGGGGMGGGKPGMGGPGMGLMDMDNEMTGMMGMGSMGMGRMQTPSALPGFPGASHIYHIGATGFFLDHPSHITFSATQQAALNELKEKTLLDQATAQRKIDEGEQELWTLTASDQPDAGQIEAKIREIETLRGDKRLAFIRAVGEAAQVLTDEQRQTLLGTAATNPSAHSGH